MRIVQSGNAYEHSQDVMTYDNSLHIQMEAFVIVSDLLADGMSVVVVENRLRMLKEAKSN